MKSALYSPYVIDGQFLEQTPAEMLGGTSREGCRPIVDETLDPVPSRGSGLLPGSPESGTRYVIAGALLDKMWSGARFSLQDLKLKLAWTWDEGPVGNMSAFYRSVEAASEFAFALGVPISSFRYRKDARCHLEATASVRRKNRGEVPGKLAGEESSWLIYLPFDTAPAGADVSDADYFMDCYEVVREMAEDGILLSGTTVGEGGLRKALGRIAGDGWGVRADVSGVSDGNVPGALIQISDGDFDYADAEFLLQDVAYYPLGHPSRNGGKVEILRGGGSGVGAILDSLLQNCR